MAQSKRTVAAIRFGYGLNGTAKGAASASDLLSSLDREPIDPSITAATRIGEIKRYRVKRKDKTASGKEVFQAAKKVIQGTVNDDFSRVMARAVESEIGFGSRLTQFWADHFSVISGNFQFALLTGAQIEEAIRPNLAGYFGDMLVAASTHPSMLKYLDQVLSVGNNSKAGKNSRQGLNENLGREILELHTMGVGASYTQKDVIELAELLTGLVVGEKGREFNQKFAEPGAETILGKTYSKRASIENIENALQDIAVHPDTANHICSKLARHFVSDEPNPDQVAYMAERYLQSGGNLRETYAAMLDHPASWANVGGKVKQPFDLVASSLRAFGVTLSDMKKGPGKKIHRRLRRTMSSMGQPYLQPGGPNGWPEDASFWITPAAMAERINWATKLASSLATEKDPRSFLKTTLDDAATPKLRALTAGAEVKWEGVALVLASPDFNRR